MSTVARLDSQSFRQLVIAVKEGIDAYGNHFVPFSNSY